VLENRVLRKTFRSTEEEVAAGWLMLHDKALRDVHWGDDIKEDEMGGACGMHEVVKNVQGFGCETPEEIDHLENLGVMEVDAKMNLTEIKWESMDRIHVVQDKEKWLAVVNMVMNLRFP
jgi:hypothetical protein